MLAAHEIIGVAADEGTDQPPTQTIQQIDSAGRPAAEIVIGVRHNDIPIAEDRDPAAKATARRGVRVDQVELREDTGRGIGDDQVLRIEEQRTVLAPGGGGICAALIVQAALARYFDET